MLIMLKGFCSLNSISYHGCFTDLLEVQAVLKSSSLAKSMIHISSLQLALQGRCFAIFEEMTGASAGGNGGSGPSFFQSFPISPNAFTAFSSISPSRLGDTFKIKLQYTLFNGIMLSFTRIAGVFTAVEGKEVFQNQFLLRGRQESAGSWLLSFEICCPAPCSYDFISV